MSHVRVRGESPSEIGGLKSCLSTWHPSGVLRESPLKRTRVVSTKCFHVLSEGFISNVRRVVCARWAGHNQDIRNRYFRMSYF